MKTEFDFFTIHFSQILSALKPKQVMPVNTLESQSYIDLRAKRGSRQAFDAALAAVPDVPAQAGDEWR